MQLLAPNLYVRFKFLWRTMHALHQSLCIPCKGKVLCYLFLALESEQSCQRTPLHSVCTPCTTLTEEKQLKLILTFTVPYTHNTIHSFIQRKITDNYKQCPHHALDQFSSIIFINENGYNCKKKKKTENSEISY
jgi:hypothetical protein